MFDNLTDETPNPSKPLSRFNAHYWAMMHGIAAALEPAPWSVLCALYCHLPNVKPGKGRLEAMTGRSMSTVHAARKLLKRCGLIDYDDSKGGGRADRTEYRVADIRNREVAEQIIRRLRDGSNDRTGPTIAPVHGSDDRTPTGPISAPHGSDDRTGTGTIIDPEVLNRSTQPSTQVKSTREAASPPAAPSGGSPSKAVGVDAPSSSPAREPTDPPVKPKLTDDLLRLLKSDATGEQMVGYYCHGSAAVGKPLAEWKGFEPSNTHWAPQTRNYGSPEPGVKVPALAAYCWCRFTQARGQAGESIELPAFLRSWRSHAAARVPFTGAEDLIDATILFIDDIGTGCYTDKSMELMFQVIDHRARYEQPTVFTSNLDLAGLEAVFGQKLLSRMVDRDIATVVKIEGENYRMRATA